MNGSHAAEADWLRKRLEADGDTVEIEDFLKLLAGTGNVKLSRCDPVHSPRVFISCDALKCATGTRFGTPLPLVFNTRTDIAPRHGICWAR